MKAKRSTDDEDLCEKFVFNEEHEKAFYSPGYPSTYVKNITCTRVLQGKKFSLDFYKSLLRETLN